MTAAADDAIGEGEEVPEPVILISSNHHAAGLEKRYLIRRTKLRTRSWPAATILRSTMLGYVRTLRTHTATEATAAAILTTTCCSLARERRSWRGLVISRLLMNLL